MAEKFVEEIYFYANTINKIKRIIEMIRLMNDDLAILTLKNMLKDIEKTCNDCIRDGYIEAERLKESLISMASIKDIILLADVLENISVPIMEGWLQSWSQIDTELDDRYIIESTASGFLTIRDTRTNRYLHSNNDPMDEAYHFVKKQYKYDKKSYVIWGCGLGYHVYQLYLLSDGSIPIRVCDTDCNMIKYAYDYGVLGWIPKDLISVEIIDNYDMDINSRDYEGSIILYPFIDSIQDTYFKSRMDLKYFKEENEYERIHDVRLNFQSNRVQGLPNVHKLNDTAINNEAVVIGGGPSLDYYMETIRSWKGGKTLIAVGTVWKRLLREGIKPDYVVIFDPSDAVFNQVKGIEDQSATLILSMQANWQIARYYKGPIYMACTLYPGSGIEEYAEKNGFDVWFSGGSVSVLALEFAIRIWAKRIYMVGVDMGYPGAVSHATGTMQRRKVDITSMKKVAAVDGGLVYTDNALTTYREWIEYIIKEINDIEYINMSKNGAVIEGTILYDDIEHHMKQRLKRT